MTYKISAVHLHCKRMNRL